MEGGGTFQQASRELEGRVEDHRDPDQAQPSPHRRTDLLLASANSKISGFLQWFTWKQRAGCVLRGIPPELCCVDGMKPDTNTHTELFLSPETVRKTGLEQPASCGPGRAGGHMHSQFRMLHENGAVGYS